MDGLEFLGRLNKKCGKSKIPVIELLKSGAESTGVQALKMGAHDYLLRDSDDHYFELLPILVSRIYAEQQTIGVLSKTASVHQTVADIIPSVIYQLSLQGGPHDVHISRQLSELGLSADKWGNDTELHHQLCHEKDRPVVKAALEQCYKTGVAFQCEYRVNTLGGVVRWFHDKAKVISDKHGRPLFLQGVMTDISNSKAMESELLHYREMLDKMVHQRTERLDRRLSILEACNSTLGENYHLMHQMYLDLLAKAQAREEGLGVPGIA
jgi:CheY-like chemotaxis protein